MIYLCNSDFYCWCMEWHWAACIGIVTACNMIVYVVFIFSFSFVARMCIYICVQPYMHTSIYIYIQIHMNIYIYMRAKWCNRTGIGVLPAEWDVQPVFFFLSLCSRLAHVYSYIYSILSFDWVLVGIYRSCVCACALSVCVCDTFIFILTCSHKPVGMR